MNNMIKIITIFSLFFVTFSLNNNVYSQIQLIGSFAHDEKTDINKEIFTTDVVVSPNGQYVLTCGSSNSVILWDIHNGEKLRTFAGNHSICSLAFSSDGTKVVAGGNVSKFTIWDFSTGEILQIWDDPKIHPWAALESINFSPDGKKVIADVASQMEASYGIFVWDAETGEQLYELPDPEGFLSHMKFSQKGDQIFISATNEAYIVNANTGEKINEFVVQENTEIVSTNFSEIVCVERLDNDNYAYKRKDVFSDQILHVKNLIKTPRGRILTEYSDGKIALTAIPSGSRKYTPTAIMELATGRVLSTFKDMGNKIYDRFKIVNEQNFLIAITEKDGADIFDISNLLLNVPDALKYK